MRLHVTSVGSKVSEEPDFPGGRVVLRDDAVTVVAYAITSSDGRADEEEDHTTQETTDVDLLFKADPKSSRKRKRVLPNAENSAAQSKKQKRGTSTSVTTSMSEMEVVLSPSTCTSMEIDVTPDSANTTTSSSARRPASPSLSSSRKVCYASRNASRDAESASVQRVDMVLWYACHTATTRGKFNPQKAKALGVKPGPLFGKSMKGNMLDGVSL